MARGANAAIAVDRFKELIERDHLDAASAWKAIAKLLLSCNVWEGKTIGWQPLFENCIVFRERNDFEDQNQAVRAGMQLARYLAGQLGVPA